MVKRLLLILIVFLALYDIGLLVLPAHAKHSAVAIDTALVEMVPETAKVLHPILNYSLIPGGISTLVEFRAAVAANSVLRARFADFNWDAAYITRTQNPMYVFVSFVKDGHLFWTKKPMLIPAGEAIITDGVHTILMRCGNEIAWTPQTPEQDTDTSLLATPEVPSFDIPMLGSPIAPPMDETSVTSAPVANTPLFVGSPVLAGPPLLLANIVSPSPTPEPKSLWLTLTGICFGLFAKFKGRRVN